jgi:hypothetical protein
MFKPEYKRGDRIRLNERAREWTRDRVFTVDAVRPFGVRCYVAVENTADLPGVHFYVGGSLPEAHYMAMWDEIAGKVVEDDDTLVALRGM